MIRLRPLLFASLLVSAVTLQSAPPADTSHLGASSAPAELYAAAKPLRTVSARHAEARRLFEWAAAAGHVPSMLELADMVGGGQGGERDPDAALALFRRAADTGDVTAMLRLASLYFRPSVGRFTYQAWRDSAAGQALVEKAAATGDAEAWVRLAQILESGTGGVRDVPRSLEAWEKAVAAGRTNVQIQRDRVRDNLRLTPEQKLARYRTELQRAARQKDPSKERGFALSHYVGSIYGGGLDLEATAAIVNPVIAEMVETDFYAIFSARSVALLPWHGLFNQVLTAEQQQVLTQINRHNARHAGVAEPGIKPGQGWSDAFPAGASAAVTPAPKPQPAKAAVAAAPAQPTRELSEFTRDAKTWEEFFAGSARRPQAFFIQHLSDVQAFRQQHPATSEQLRTAYRRARAALRPTPGTDRGLEFGAQFVAYHLALLENGLAETDAAAWVRDDFLQLARTDIYNAHHVLMGVQNIAPLQKLLPAPQNAQIREIAGRVVKREPLPKVGEATPAAPAVATTSAPARPTPAGGAPGFAPRFSTTSIAGHWNLNTNLFGAGGRRFDGQIRFEGGEGVVRAVVFDPFSNSPKRSNAGIIEQRVGAMQQVQRTLSFRLDAFTYTGVFDPSNLRGNIMRGNDVVGSWTAGRRIDLDYLVVARAAGQTPEAIAAYDEAIRANPLASYRLERAGVHFDNRDYLLAIADYDEVLKVTPGHGIARYNRMLAHRYARQYDQALADADHLLDRGPVPDGQRALVHFMRGEILWWLERHDEADQAYAAAIELDPKLAERTRAAGTREGALARMAANAARVNAITSRLYESMAESTEKLKAANAAVVTDAADVSAPEVPASPSQQVLALYAALQPRLTAPEADWRDPSYTEALALLASLMPAAREILDQGYAEVRRAFAATQPAHEINLEANRAFHAGDKAEAIRLWEQAAAEGNADAVANLAVQREGAPAQNTPATEPDAYRDLLLRAAEAGSPDAYTRLAAYFYSTGPGRDLTRAADFARRAVAVGHFPSGYYHYLSVHNLLSEAARQPAQAERPDATAIAAAIEDLATAALHGHAASMYSLGNYHLGGRLPGSRTVMVTPASPEYTAFNLPLARFWLQQAAARPDDLNARGRELAAQALARAEQALAVLKGREWTADEVIAALEAGINDNAVAFLLAREGARFTRSEHTRILTSPAGAKLGEYSLLLMQLGMAVVTGPENAAQELAAAAIAERRRTVSPLPFPGADLAALRRGFEAGDPAAAYALLHFLPQAHQGSWPAEGPPRERVVEVALSRDYAPAQYLRIDLEGLENRVDRARSDPPRSFALALASARAGSAAAARRVADYYRGVSGVVPVRRNYAEAEWWYAQAAALAWPGQFQSIGDILEPARNLAHLYQFEIAGLGMGVSLPIREESTLRWVRELRRRGGAAKTLADERVVYWGTADAGRQNVEPLIAALPPELPPFSTDELARLERDAAAGQPEALRTLARALAHGEGGLRQDDARAADLYRRAAEAGDAEAMTVLTEIYRRGFGVRADLVAVQEWRARAEGKTLTRIELLVAAARASSHQLESHPLVETYLREAITLGSVEAKHSLGSYLVAGQVLPKDVAAGLRLIEEAAEAGDVRAMRALGSHYRQGQAVPADPVRAHRWRVRAAEAGDQSSINALVDDFDRGRNGAPQDAREALRWARLVAPGNDTTRRNLTRLEREVAALDRHPGLTIEALRREQIQNLGRLAEAARQATIEAAEPGAAVFARAASLQGDARLAALREAAQAGHVQATLDLIEDLARAGSLHEAHWWTRRDWVLEHEDAYTRRDSLERRGDFSILGLRSESDFGGTSIEGFSMERDQALEASMPELAEALARAGNDPRRLREQVERIYDRNPERAEAHIALAQLSMDRPDFARTLLEKAVELDATHPQAHVLLARLEAASGQAHRAYYRLLELAEVRPNSLQGALARAELLLALGGSARECAALRIRIHRLIKDEPPGQAKLGALFATLKLAEGARDRKAYLDDLNAAIEIQPAPQLLLQRAQLAEQDKDYPRALADYTALLNSPLGQNPPQAAELRTRIEALRKQMDSDTTQMREQTKMIEDGLERVREADSPEARRRMGDRIGAGMDFVAGKRAYEAGDIEKARELWTGAAAAGHKEAAERLKLLSEKN